MGFVPALPVVLKCGRCMPKRAAVGLNIPKGVAELVVAEVAGQKHQVMRERRSLSAPPRDPVGGEGVPEIVQSHRLKIALRLERRGQPMKIKLDVGPQAHPAFATVADKEMLASRIQLPPSSLVTLQRTDDRRVNRKDPLRAELAWSDTERASARIEVAITQTYRFADPQAGAPE